MNKFHHFIKINMDLQVRHIDASNSKFVFRSGLHTLFVICFINILMYTYIYIYLYMYIDTYKKRES